MNTPVHRFLLFASALLPAVVLLGAPGPAATTTTATPTASGLPASPTLFTVGRAADHFDRTRQRIDALLKRRLNPEPLPPVLPNPFQLSDETPTVSGSRTPSTDVPTTPTKVDPPIEFLQPGSDEEVLARYVPTLKVSGTGQLSGRPYAIINSSPYREGERILVSNKNPQVYLLIVRIVPGEITLGYNEKSQVLKIKN